MNQLVNLICTLVILTAVIIMISQDKVITKAEYKLFKEWLINAVAAAEHEFGSNTGIVKFRTVYAKAIEMFPKLMRTLTADTLSDMIDDIKESDTFKSIMEKFNMEVE